MSITLHLLAEGTDIHLRLPEITNADEILEVCAEAMRGRRVIEFTDAMPPGGVRRTKVLVNFEHVSGAWVDAAD
ncbi:MAG TPA: hypothetical protein VHZ96_23075 [Frankiaceae bacterium]|nr:hypothetical protein [Frankiaceae bacterium]